MSETDNRSPIRVEHIEFAQAVVALAREHSIQTIKVQFTGPTTHPHLWTSMTADWSRGRHGADSEVTLRAEAILRTTEKP